jgi:hypothetical protein
MAIAGCSGDHDFLAQKNVDAAAPIDAVDATDIRSEDRRSTGSPADVGEASLDDRADVSEPPEPPGRWTFTWTNGLVDVASARFCFVPVAGGRELRDQVVSLPSQGLPFGKSLVLGELSGVELSTMGVHPYAVVGGGAGVEGGASCDALLNAQDGAVADDGAARGPMAVSLPLIPAGTLAEGRSYLGVVTGCALRWPYADAEAGTDASDGESDAAEAGDASSRDDGGSVRDASDEKDATVSTDAIAADGADAGPTDVVSLDVFRPPARAAICGGANGASNAGLVLVRLSRRDAGARFGFQAVHASTAVAAARIAMERPGGSAPIFSADLAHNQIVPRDGLIAVTRDELGPSLGATMLRIASPVSAFPTVTLSLESALAASGIEESALVEGDLLSLVLVGAQPGQSPGPPWNAAGFAVVRNAPLRGGD